MKLRQEPPKRMILPKVQTDSTIARMQKYRDELLNYFVYMPEEKIKKREMNRYKIMQEINAVEKWIDNAINEATYKEEFNHLPHFNKYNYEF